MIAFSVVIPAHNEAESLPVLIAELAMVIALDDKMAEVIIVDDGSTDETCQVVRKLQQKFSFMRLIRLDDNYGQSAAMDVGFRYARGGIIVTLDADGQNPPAEIPRLLCLLDEYDMVCGWRRGRKDTWSKRLASRVANWVRRSVLNDGVRDTGCSLKAFRSEVVERIKLFHGMHRFLPALVRMEGYSVVEIPVAHRPRQKGITHYGILNRLLGPFLDLLGVLWLKRRTRPWRVQSLSIEEHRRNDPAKNRKAA